MPGIVLHVEITEKNLTRFREWMIQRGRQEGSAKLYVTNLRSCSRERTLTSRLVDGGLAPNTMHANAAALRAWAKFSKNRELAEVLDDIRLPPARRVRAKPPLEVDVLRRVVQHLRSCDMSNEAVRQVLLIMALRGLRVSDVLRIQRAEVVRSLASGRLMAVTKGRKRTPIDIRPIRHELQALAEIRGWSSVQDLVTKSPDPRVATNRIWRAARRTAKAVGIDGMHPHRYRHTFATRYLERLAGDPNALNKLQRFMGWENLATAARYVDHVEQEDLDRVGSELVDDLG